jgi:hypothetical protein
MQSASRVFAGVFWLVHEGTTLRSNRNINETTHPNGSSSCLQSILAIVAKSTGLAVAIIIGFFALYYFAASPPLHLFYDVAPPAGPASVYLPVSEWRRRGRTSVADDIRIRMLPLANENGLLGVPPDEAFPLGPVSHLPPSTVDSVCTRVGRWLCRILVPSRLFALGRQRP